MKIAIVHYWFVGMRGGEKVVEALCEMFPQADLFVHVYDPLSVSEIIRKHQVRTTFIQRLPAANRFYKFYLPLMPLALEQLDLRSYDLVISSESGPAKGGIVSPGALHLCYCHTPMRYIWDMYHNYIEGMSRVKGWLIAPLLHYMRSWDVISAARVDQFIANSHYVRDRISKYYRRESEVIYPPVDTEAFSSSRERADFYLMVGQLVHYKRVDLAVEAFNRTGKRLIIIGEGEELKALKRKACQNISFLGWQPFPVMRDYYARCRALIFPGIEDFGIVPVEAMASGRPVIAFKRGGALETVIEGVTGLFFDEQTTEALVDAIEHFEKNEGAFSSEDIIQHAKKYNRQEFKKRIHAVITRLTGKKNSLDIS